MSHRLGPVLHSFFVDHLGSVKGLRPASVQSYRDAIRLFLLFVADEEGRKLSRLDIEHLSFERVLKFLNHLENARGNRAQTRNQRLAALQAFFDYVGGRLPERLEVCGRVAAIPRKRAPKAQVTFLERDEMAAIIGGLPSRGPRAQRDHALILFLYNTGARVQEAAGLRRNQLDLEGMRVRLHGKGDKWRTCPLWKETAVMLGKLLGGSRDAVDAPVFTGQGGRPLTRFGIYKIVRRHAGSLDRTPDAPRRGRITPHVFRHTTAVHLLESGVELNVIRGWLGHVDISTTTHYAEINTKTKEAALRACDPLGSDAGFPRRPAWRDDDALLKWLASL